LAGLATIAIEYQLESQRIFILPNFVPGKLFARCFCVRSLNLGTPLPVRRCFGILGSVMVGQARNEWDWYDRAGTSGRLTKSIARRPDYDTPAMESVARVSLAPVPIPMMRWVKPQTCVHRGLGRFLPKSPQPTIAFPMP
jgi:hypothetical protein